MNKGLQLLLMGFTERRGRGRIAMFPGAAIFTITCITLGVAINYIVSVSSSVVSLVQDVFILLFVLDIDEKALDVVRYYDPIWTGALIDEVVRRFETTETSIDGSARVEATEAAADDSARVEDEEVTLSKRAVP
jgi:hypothetical protein